MPKISDFLFAHREIETITGVTLYLVRVSTRKGSEMDKYEAYRQMKEITEIMKGTSFAEALQMATDALLEKIQREEDSCETCKIGGQ